MAISPGAGSDLAAEVARLVQEAELLILERISGALAKDMAAPDWAQKKADELARVRAQLARDVQALTQALPGQVQAAVNGAYTLGVEGAYQDLQQRPVASELPGARAYALQALAAESIALPVAGLVVAATSQILRTATDAYQKAVAAGAANVLLGTQTRRQATQATLDRLLGQGITTFVDRDGKNWNLSSYVEMATRTATTHAAIEGHMQTLAEYGEDLVRVIMGPRACPICDGWANRILSVSGATPGHPTLAEARAGGWGHPNCRCTTGIYISGVTNLNVPRPESDTYEDGQEQRRLERGIREWKRRAALAMDPQAKAQANGKVREWQGKMRDHMDSHPDLRRLRHREGLVAGRVTGVAPTLKAPSITVNPMPRLPVPDQSPLRVLAGNYYDGGTDWQVQKDPRARAEMMWTETHSGSQSIRKVMNNRVAGLPDLDGVDLDAIDLRKYLAKDWDTDEIMFSKGDLANEIKSAATILSESANNASVTPHPLYRGMNVSSAEGLFKPGDIVPMEMTSWTARESVARQYSEMGYDARSGGYTIAGDSILMEITDARAVPLDSDYIKQGRFSKHDEWLARGHVIVDSVEKVDGVTIVRGRYAD